MSTTGAVPHLRVVAGILRDAVGRVLLAQRPQGKPHAGLWEFPGGKIEPGESEQQALRRELEEELQVGAGRLSLFHRTFWRYPGLCLELIAYEVHDYLGAPVAHHAPALRWEHDRALLAIEMPEADRPIAVALMLPPIYAITPEPGSDLDAFDDGLERTLAGGVRMIQLRARTLARPALERLAARALVRARRHQVLILLNGDHELARALGYDGVHLRADQVRSMSERPLPREFLVGSSCHDDAELGKAQALGADFSVLGPVLASPSHPGVATLGWDRFGTSCAASSLSTYALGGMSPALLGQAMAAGAHGVAGISGFWRTGAIDHPSSGREARE